MPKPDARLCIPWWAPPAGTKARVTSPRITASAARTQAAQTLAESSCMPSYALLSPPTPHWRASGAAARIGVVLKRLTARMNAGANTAASASSSRASGHDSSDTCGSSRTPAARARATAS